MREGGWHSEGGRGWHSEGEGAGTQIGVVTRFLDRVFQNWVSLTMLRVLTSAFSIRNHQKCSSDHHAALLPKRGIIVQRHAQEG
eukprot:1152787-Pelagomonas_calceolata.AAC.2